MRPTDDTTKLQLSVTADGNPGALPPDNNGGGDGPRSRDADRDLDGPSHSREHRLWTPEPEPYDDEKYMAWGQKHYGADWYEQRKIMLQERNIYTPKDNDYTYRTRQDNLRKMEREMEKGKVAEKAKTWPELVAWARWHYGEDWYKMREVKKSTRDRSKAYKLDELMERVTWERDMGLLAEGKTWHEVLASPASPSNALPSAETGMAIASAPSMSSQHSNSTGYDADLPSEHVPREARRWPDDPWARIEFSAVRTDGFEYVYEQDKVRTAARLKSDREDEACDRREKEENDAIDQLRWTSPLEFEHQLRELNDRIHRANRKQVGLAGQATSRSSGFGLGLFRPPTEQEADETLQAWKASGVSRERLVELARTGFHRELGPEPGTADAPASKSTSQARQKKVASRKTRGSRIMKNATPNRRDGRKNVRSRRPAPIPAEASIPDHQPERFEEGPTSLGELINSPTPVQRRIQHKTYQKERASRRLAGQPPEFGMLLGRGEAPSQYQTSWKQPSGTRSTSRLGTRALSTGPTVKGTEPQRVSKSRKAKTKRPKSRKDRLRAG
ncbi:MAG: hypothetical protein Q9211_001801 [Gyalolechia sp. 1 TL-2023]